MQILLHTLAEVAIESAKMLPLLFLAFSVIEFIEHRALDKLKNALSHRQFGVISAALVGIFPQCGFSAAAANLYSERLITAGALIAVFVSTSDESIPLLAADPTQARWLLPLIAVKLIWAIIVGFCVDIVFRALKLDRAKPHSHESHSHEHVHEAGEHHHCASCDSREGIFKSALKRTFSILIFIFVTGIVLHLAVHLVGEDRLAKLLMTDSLAQPIVSALLGLIPNCAVSVVLSELFAAGTLSFGSLCAGLCSGAGVGILVLVRSNREVKQNLAIIGSLYVLSALLGVILQLII